MNIDGFACVIPTLVVLVLAVLSKRTIEPLVGGTVVGLAMLAPSELLTNFTDVILTVMQDETIGWVIMVCGLMGGLIAVLARIGGASAFGRLASRRVRTRASALLATWLLGLAVFIDDYLNALAISSSMKRLTDRFRVSREMLAYVVDSTAAPICVLVPLSTWTVFFAAVLEDSAAAETGQGLSVYIGAIPYMFYAWAAVIIVPLVIVGAIPVFGPMKKVEGQVRALGYPKDPEDWYRAPMEVPSDKPMGSARRTPMKTSRQVAVRPPRRAPKEAPHRAPMGPHCPESTGIVRPTPNSAAPSSTSSCPSSRWSASPGISARTSSRASPWRWL